MMENKNGRDTTEVLLTRKQMNKKLTVMAFTGYLVNLIITLLFGREILTFTESNIASLAFGKDTDACIFYCSGLSVLFPDAAHSER